MSFDLLCICLLIFFQGIFLSSHFSMCTQKRPKLYHVRDLLIAVCATKRNTFKIHKSIIKSSHATQSLNVDSVFWKIRYVARQSGGKSSLNDRNTKKFNPIIDICFQQINDPKIHHLFRIIPEIFLLHWYPEPGKQRYKNTQFNYIRMHNAPATCVHRIKEQNTGKSHKNAIEYHLRDALCTSWFRKMWWYELTEEKLRQKHTWLLHSKRNYQIFHRYLALQKGQHIFFGVRFKLNWANSFFRLGIESHSDIC